MAVWPSKRNKKRHGLLRGMRIKLWASFFIICIIFSALVARIMYIQYTSGSRYEKQVLSQMSYDSSVIPYKRGDITDTNGTVLATSIDVYSLILDSYILNSESAEVVDDTLTLVGRYFPEISETDMREWLSSNPDGRYHVLLKDIPYDTMSAFSEEKKEKGLSSGIWFEKSYIRYYPYNSLAADVIGFASAEGSGVIGMENSYNDELTGINGRAYGYLDDDYTRERRTENAVNGNTLVTTIDINIQSILEEEIRLFNENLSSEESFGSLETAAIIMDPRNGNILAMADYPTFDLNNPRDLSLFYSEEEVAQLSNEEQMDALNNLWQNFAIYHTFEPGSTIKPFTVACGLETGTLNGDESYYCDGYEEISDWKIRCVNENGHGMLSVQGALSESCNDALMQMSYAIGPSNFAYYQRLFGFGQRTNIDITGESRTDKVVYTPEELQKRINLATNSFGQNFNVTMIQLATAFCSLINGGNLYEPHLVKSILDSSGNVSVQKNAIEEKVTVSRETSDAMRVYLENVVKEGTAKTAGVAGYTIGGKTGTAEKLPRGMGNYLVSFIGFAPVEDPEIVIYVVVDEPNTLDQAHSSFAQEIAHNVLEQVLVYMGVERDLTELNEEVFIEEELAETEQ